MKNKNLDVPGGAPRNSFHTTIPHIAAIIAFPCPNPNEIVKPAFPADRMLSMKPIHHTAPPSIPNKWSLLLPLK